MTPPNPTMPLSHASPTQPFHRGSSYTSSTPPSSLKPHPLPHSQPRWHCGTCLFPNSLRSRRHRRQALPDPYPEAAQPHYFDSYTGTWSPRKVPLTPAGRSGIWSPRALASRLSTPARRPTTPKAAPTAKAVPADDDAPPTPMKITPLPKEGKPSDEEKKNKEPEMISIPTMTTTSPKKSWSPPALRRRRQRGGSGGAGDLRTLATVSAAKPSPVPSSLRPPSRGKQQQQNPQQYNHPDPITNNNNTTDIENHFISYPFTAHHNPLDPTDSNWIVTQVSLPARRDTNPLTRDFAADHHHRGGLGMAVIDDVVIEEEEEDEDEDETEEGKGQISETKQEQEHESMKEQQQQQQQKDEQVVQKEKKMNKNKNKKNKRKEKEK